MNRIKNPGSPVISAEAFIKRKNDSPSLTAVYNIIMSCTASAGAVFAFITAFKSFFLPTDALIGFLLGVFVCIAVELSIIFTKRQMIGNYILIGFAATTLGAIFILRRQISNALIGLTVDFLNAADINSDPIVNLIDNVNIAGDSRAANIIFSIFFTVFVYYIYTKAKAVPALMLLTMPVCLTLFGIAPKFPALILLTGSFAAFSAYKTSQKGITAFTAFLIAVLACLISMLFYNRVGTPENITQLRDDTVEYFKQSPLNQIAVEIKNAVLPDNSSSMGAINHGNVGVIDAISFSNKVMLIADLPKSDSTIYLRGFIAADFENNRWTDFPPAVKSNEAAVISSFEGDERSPLLFDGINFIGGETLSFRISDLTNNDDYIYLPYTLVPQSGESFLNRTGTDFILTEKTYSGEFYNAFDSSFYQQILNYNTPISDPVFADDETRYRLFVYENYLSVPADFAGDDLVLNDEFLDYITYESVTEGKSTLNSQTVFARKLFYIKRWLRDNCSYTLDAGSLPRNEDFINYFLAENLKGSCSHFASAAVMLCRSAGIPARYVEGFVVKPKDFGSGENYEIQNVDIKDTRAHAWAEIYIDGFGWYPYEFTPGYGNIRTGLTAAERLELEKPTVTSVQPAVTTALTGGSEIPAPAAVTTAPITTVSTEPGQISAESTPAETELTEGTETPLKDNSSFLILWLLLLIIPLGIGVIFLRRVIIINKRRFALKNLTPEKAQRLLYNNLCEILRRDSVNINILSDYEDFSTHFETRNPEYKDSFIIIKYALLTSFANLNPQTSDIVYQTEILDKTRTHFINKQKPLNRFILEFVTVL
ncbi:MAG: transglutaminase-like domain-containing protein [Ruminococcus sp.]|jgi:transglutaminase-like putative cysteine protease|nr:transglutaminase-like domain-containing protein [Ruminococcus sp.]